MEKQGKKGWNLFENTKKGKETVEKENNEMKNGN